MKVWVKLNELVCQIIRLWGTIECSSSRSLIISVRLETIADFILGHMLNLKGKNDSDRVLLKPSIVGSRSKKNFKAVLVVVHFDGSFA